MICKYSDCLDLLIFWLLTQYLIAAIIDYVSEAVDFNLDGGCQTPPMMQCCVSIC